MQNRELKIFSGQANQPLAKAICGFLNLPLGAISLGKFPDGENFCKIEEDVRGRDVFLIQPTCPPVNDNLMELLIMIDSCKRASAARITAVIPYFGYARQDRKDEGRTPITAKLTANLITRAGADRVLTMDLHAAQIQGFFDVPVDHLYAAPVLNEHFLKRGLVSDEIVVVSPDEGSIKRASGHAKRLGRQTGHCRQTPRDRAEDETGKHHRRAGRGARRPDVRRHDQHRRLHLRSRPPGARGRRAGNPCRGHPRRALRPRHPEYPVGPHHQPGDHQQHPAPRRSASFRRSRC